MCGIFFSVSEKGFQEPSQGILDVLEQRGPDSIQTVQRTIHASHKVWYLTFISTVLALRGDTVISQPLVHDDGSLLCWNGEAWTIEGVTVVGNDGQVVLEKLISPNSRDLTSIHCVLRQLSGPYSFIFFDNHSQCLFYGRDSLGRRSLLVNQSNPGELSITSTSEGRGTEWLELETKGIYLLDLGDSGRGADERGLRTPQISSWNEVAHSGNSGFAPFQLVSQELTSGVKGFSSVINLDCTPPNNNAVTLNSNVVKDLRSKLHNSLVLRLNNIPLPPSDTINPTRVAILFSGGLDCTLLARLSSDIIPKEQAIDLLNVAFENPRVVAAAKKLESATIRGTGPSVSAYENCPDRITGRSSYLELQRTCPNRKWNFVAINIPFSELEVHKQRIINLMYPHNTEMDFSISCALYFAARGQGDVTSANQTSSSYSTPARVLLSGLGADELFGGYTRHATAHRRGGLPALIGELELDYKRIGQRNLGRDDRVISNWGKEVRYPYLDECFVKWTLGSPVWEKCSFGMEVAEGEPDLEPGKHLLRLLMWKLGMHGAAREKKRAIQFGARTAKMVIGRTKGTDAIA
jgi:asparagine synthetase B (glutamine-hydrolysing)